jgi:hypothetical protein
MVRRAALCLVAGSVLILWALWVYTRLTVHDPLATFLVSNPITGRALALVFMCLLTWYWVGLLGAKIEVWEILVIGGTFVGLSLLLLVATGDLGGGELVRFRFWEHWWMVPSLSAAAYPLSKPDWHTGFSAASRAWLLFGATSFSLGVVIYLLPGGSAPLSMLLKSALILLVPATCFASVAIRYRGRASRYVRLLSAIAALFGLGTAALS